MHDADFKQRCTVYPVIIIIVEDDTNGYAVHRSNT